MSARISKYQLHVNQLTFALLTIYKKVPENPVVKVTQNGTRRFPSYQRNFPGATDSSEKASSPVVPNRNSCAISSTLFDGLILRLDTVTF